MLRVVNGSITNEFNSVLINNMAIIVDADGGVLLKYGDIDTSNLRDYYFILVEKYRMVSKEMADNIKLIEFDRYNGVLDINDICTIVNYGMNCHSEKFMELFEMDKDDLKDEVERLRQYGY